MKKKSPRCAATPGFLLAVSVALAWVPSASGQQRLQEVALANLASPFAERGMPPFKFEATHRGTTTPIRFLPDPDGRRSLQRPSRPESARPAATALRIESFNVGPVSPVRSPDAMAGGRFEFGRLSITDSPRAQRPPMFYEEDTPFSSVVRLPIAHIWGRRLQFDIFYRELSRDRFLRGLPESRDLWWTTRGDSAVHFEESYGISLRFRLF